MRPTVLIAAWGFLALLTPIIVACAPITSATTYKTLPPKSSASSTSNPWGSLSSPTTGS